MIYRRLFSGFILAILLTIGLLVNFAGLAKADVNEQEKTSFGRASLLSGLVLPPNARLEKPLLQNTPVLTITKIAPQQVTAGQTLTYTIIVSNSTITDATNAIITDTLDTSKLTFSLPLSASFNSGTVTWEPITITGFSLITRTLLVTVNADVPAGGTLTNTVGVTSTEGAGDSDTVTSTITTAADISIGKSSNPTSTVIAGETLTYTLTITNAGPSNAQNVVVTDTLPANVTVLSTNPLTDTQLGTALSWDIGTLASGSSQIITAVISVNSNVTETLQNSATVTTTTTDPDTNDHNQTINTTVQTRADLSISKTYPAEIIAGEMVTYTITIENLGPSDAQQVIISDILPISFTLVSVDPVTDTQSGQEIGWAIETLPDGMSEIFTVTVAIDSNAIGTLNNIAEVTSATTDPISGNNQTDAITLTTKANLTISKIDESNPVIAGTILTYTLTITNNGPSSARNVLVTDTPSVSITVLSTSPTTDTQIGAELGWDLDTLIVGATRTITMVVEVDSLARGSIENTASVTSTTIDPYTNDNSHTISTDVDAEVDLVLSKIDIYDFLSGTNIIYRLTITNTGPSAATNVVLTDTLPSDVYFPTMPGNCSLPSSGTIVCNWNIIGSGDSKTINLGVQASGPGIYLNQATVTSNYDETETKPLDNFDDEETTVLPANPSITKSGPTSVRVGDPLTYILTIENSVRPDNNEARNVVLTDTLPSSVIFASSNPSTCNNNSGVVTCDLGNIDNGHDLSVTITVTPTIAGTIVNTAEISADNPDFDITDNIATKTTIIDPVTDLTISKSATPNPVTAGESLAYTIVITNNGPSEATGIIVTDTLPVGVTFDSGSGCTDQGGGIVRCLLTNLLSGQPHTFIINVDVGPGTRGTITNNAIITGNEFDPVNNNSASVETLVSAETNLSISKSANPSIAIPGGSLIYTLIITNSGPSNATGLVVTDTLPNGVSFVSGSGCSNLGGGIVRCTLSNLPRNDTHSFALNTSVAPNVTQTLQNQVRVTSNENSVAVSDTLFTGVNPQTDLDITKTASPGAALPGDTITYVLTVYNNGPSDATGIVVTDTLPADVNFLSVTPGAPTCLGTGTIVCNLGDLAVNDPPIEVTIEVTVNEDAAGTISNQATVSGNEEDPSAGNNISPQVSTAIGEFNKVYLPVIIKPAPTNLYIENDTSGQVTFTVFGTGVSCTVPAGAQNHYCGDFPPGTYTVQAVTTQCGTGTTVRTYASGYQNTRVFCN